MNNEWKAYEYYCKLCANNKMSPLSFEQWKSLLDDSEEDYDGSDAFGGGGEY